MELSLVQILAGLGVCVTGWLVWNFARDTEKGMRAVSHLPEQLPSVMTGRYAGFFILALAVFLNGQPGQIAVLYGVFAFVAFWDAAVYYRIGKPFGPHFGAGLASALVAVAALASQGGRA
jgi:hypothetical protein